MEIFEPFDFEHCHEEVTWIISLLSFYIPEEFSLEKLASILINYQHGAKLIYSVKSFKIYFICIF